MAVFVFICWIVFVFVNSVLMNFSLCVHLYCSIVCWQCYDAAVPVNMTLNVFAFALVIPIWYVYLFL